MLTPEQFQELILPYLYDLLDQDERRAFEAALEAAPEAKAELASVRDKQKLLAEAVKEQFPEVIFAPPMAAQVLPLKAPAGDDLSRAIQRRNKEARKSWIRWSVAAAVLLLVFGGSGALIVSGWFGHQDRIAQAGERIDKASRAAAEFENKVKEDRARAQENIRAIQEQINMLVEDWNKEALVQKKVFDQKQVQVIIQSPRALQAGASNSIQIEMKRQPKAPMPAKGLPLLTARVVDETSKEVLYDTVLDTSAGQTLFKLDLPRDLPVRPGMNLALEVKSKGGDGTPIEVREHLSLAAPEYMTHLFTDRPMYRPGEKVRFRSLTLDRFSLKPAQEELRLRFRLTGPNNVEIDKLEGAAEVAAAANEPARKGPDGQAITGIGAGEFQLHDLLPGGQYTLHVSEARDRFPAEKRTFIVHQWQAPRLNKELTFDRASYGPGEKVEILARVTRAEGRGEIGEPPQGGQMDAVVRVTVDGKKLLNDFHQRPDANGRLTLFFNLPPVMTQGQGIVSITFNDGGNQEALVRPIPIVMGKMLVDFYPEGGDLVPGLKNRVYFQARTVAGKPADLRGRVVDQAGAVVARAQTLTDDQEPGVNQGLGVFEFTPEAAKKYEVKIDSPAGMHGKDGKQRYFLPVTKPGAVVLRVPKGVVQDTIDVEVTSAAKDRQLLVGAYCRGKLLDHVELDAKAGKPATATLRPAVGVGGVYRITVFEKTKPQFTPLAERLIYRKSPEKLNLAVTSDKKVYYPGDRVQLSLQAADEKKELSPAILLVSVVDLSVHKLADDKTARTMPTHFFLTSEVRRPEDLENADFFLGTHPKAEQALDLLLGVQGWRRFAEQDPVRFKKQQHPEGDRVLQAAGPGGMQTNNPEKEVLAQVDSKFAPKFVDLQKQLAETEKVELVVPEAQQEMQLKQAAIERAQGELSGAVNRMEDYQRFLVRLGLGFLVIGALLLGLFLLYWGMRRLSRGRTATGFFVVGSLVLLFLFMGSLAGTFFMMGGRGFNRFNRHWDEGPVAFKNAAPQAMAPPMEEDAKMEAIRARPGDVELPALEFARREPDMEGPNPPADRLALAMAKEAVPQEFAAPAPFAGVPGVPAGPGGAEGPDVGFFEMMPGQRANVNGERNLRLQGNFKEILRMRLKRTVNVPSSTDPFIVREYAHRRDDLINQGGLRRNEEGVRMDFTETLYWHPVLVLDNGKAEIGFDLSDANTRFQVLVFGHSPSGRLGAATHEIVSRMPVSIEPVVPIEVANTDKIRMPVSVANDQKEPASASVLVSPKNLEFITDVMRPQPNKVELSLEGNKRVRELFPLQPTIKEGTATIRVTADFGFLGRDSVERTFKVVREGFPAAAAHSGLLEKTATHEVVLPETWVPGTLRCQVQVFPSTLAELQKGLDGLLREPNGCFEQSSSSNYPNVLILNYLKEADLSRPELEKRSRQLLGSGYGKLVSFECTDPKEGKRQGYEWFGHTAPPHEALTAYGLLQFKDMARVHPVDEDMLQRTQQYLLKQRDGKGGFKRNPRSIDSFGRAPEHITDAYIVWALTESGLGDDLSLELNTLGAKAKDSSDPYFVALVGISHINQNKTKEGVELLKNLIKFQKEEGHLDGAQTSITASRGRDLHIETTALAVLGWLKANRPEEFNVPIDKAVKWIGQQRGGYGGFGATQSTILALKALIAHTREHKRPVEPGALTLFVNERETPVAVKNFPATVQEPVVLAVPPDSDYLKPGQNRVRVQISGRNEFPYTLSWSYLTLKPVNTEDAPVHLDVRLQRTLVKEGESVRMTAKVENRSGKGQGMTVAILGLPGGLALPEDFAQLKEMAALREDGAKPGLISSWELRGRELVLYWRDLAPDAKIEVNLDLVCRLPGIYRGPASRAYLYYNADNKFWAEPLGITIRAGAE